MSAARDVLKHARKAQREAAEGHSNRAPAQDRLARYVGDPAGFAEALMVPETGESFLLYPAQRRFLIEALTLTKTGRLPCAELVYSAPKKSGKTTIAAIACLYVVRVIGGRLAEGYCVANDFDQAQGRVFQTVARIIEASPLLRGTAKITRERIEFFETGATITALPADYAGAAGANPSIVCFDELWAFTTERANRLWDELVPVPTRDVSVRLTVTYAGFEGESALLEGLYERGLKGKEIAPSLYEAEGLLMFWSHEPVAPWQTPEWVDQMRDQLRPSAFTRMILNRFAAGESGFVDVEWWDACVDQQLTPVFADRQLRLWIGVDASVRHDSTAVVAVTWDSDGKVRLVTHRIFQPSPDDPLDFEATVEHTLKEWAERFDVQVVRFDPYQLVSSAQRLERAGLPMEEYPQTLDRLTEMSSNLYELLKSTKVRAYPDRDIRLALTRAVAVESPRGWRIAKAKAAHKVDVVVALAMAALACVKECASGDGPWLVYIGGEILDLRSGQVVKSSLNW